MTHSPKRRYDMTCTVDQHRSGWTVVAFLAHRFKYHTESGWARRVADNWVRVNGESVAPEHVVNKNDDVTYSFMHAEPEVDFTYSVLYEDDDILVVDKSGNIPVHACGVFISNTLISKLKEDFGDSVFLGHRLDRETSGVIALGRHKDATRELAGRFAHGEVAKTYFAKVVGEIVDDAFVVDAPIGKIDVRHQYPDEYGYGKANDLATYLPKRTVDYEGGKPSQTRFEVVERGEGFSLVKVLPAQGRTNQIRVHLAHIGHPIVGDKIYMLSGEIRDTLLREGVTPEVKKALIAERHLLHCQSLSFRHPITDAPLHVESPLPDGFNVGGRNG